MVRINPEDPSELQWKPDSMGHYWYHRFRSKKLGNFIEIEFNSRLLCLEARTEKGSFYSTNGGKSWSKIENEE